MSTKEPGAIAGGTSKKITIISIVILILSGVLIFAFIKFFEKEQPQIELTDDISVIGGDATISFLVRDRKSGLREIKAELVQGEKRITISERSFMRPNLLGGQGVKEVEEKIPVDTRALGFQDGPATLEISARDFSWSNWQAGNTAAAEFSLTIDTKPPVVTIIYAPRYISPGGSGIIIYRLGEEAEKHGAVINGRFYPGFPATQPADGRFVSYIGLPHDLKTFAESNLIAVDKAGNRGQTPFGMMLKTARFRDDQIYISDNFLNMKLPEFRQYYPELTGTPVEQYLYINNKVREMNNEIIVEACRSPQPNQLWHDRFLRLAGSAKRAGYGDHRTYFYQNKKIDEQFHLGIDLAATSRVPVEAANRGVVVFADYLGIYGNTVILDHGQGVFSLYAHLSQLDAAVGDMVEKGGRIALSGRTGMAGGDHLHFSMLVNGVFVNPLEWWDSQWLKINITDRL
jgi:murein DD-endopeptidase MepM/ murein hydrolase activator NlpD